MKIYDKLLLFVYSIFIALVSIFLIIFPVNFLNTNSYEQGMRILRSMRGNYIYSLIGLIFLAASIRFLVYVFKGKEMTKGSFLVMRNDLGEVIIHSETIVGLVQGIVNKYSGIKNVKTTVSFVDGEINLGLHGEVNQAINIPDASKELQQNVKQHIEVATGAKVRDVKIEISSVASSTSRVR